MATIISCADSRVPPELIFGGHGVGELFVARNAGNLVDTATLGTVEYGAAVLGSVVLLVCGLIAENMCSIPPDDKDKGDKSPVSTRPS